MMLSDPPQRFPSDGAAGKQFMLDLGFQLDPRVQSVSFVECTVGRMHIAIPPAECLREALDAVENDNNYQLPPGFDEFENPNPDVDPLMRYLFRIGDYILSHCD